MSMPSRTEVKLTPNMNLLDYTLLPPAQQAALTSLPGTRLESSVLAAAAAATASPDNVVSMRYCQLMHGSCDVSAAPVSRVALWNPSHCSRVNSGRRFNRGFDRGALY